MIDGNLLQTAQRSRNSEIGGKSFFLIICQILEYNCMLVYALDGAPPKSVIKSQLNALLSP